MGRVGFIWALRAAVLLYCPAAFLLSWLHPGLGLDSAAAGVPLVSGSGIVLIRKIGPLHQCPGRHTARAALRAAVDDNTRTLECYGKWFRALGINPDSRPRKRDLTLIQGGDSNPGQRVSLPA